MHSISRIENEGSDPLWRWYALAGQLGVAIIIAICLFGCRMTRPCCDSNFPIEVGAKTKLDPQETSQLSDIRIPFIDNTERGMLPNGFEQVYPLTLSDCEMLAAQNSPLSKILEQEVGALDPCQPCSNVDPCVVDTVNGLVQASSAYQRNIVVEKALLAYLGLAEVYLQNQVAEETVSEIESLQEVLEQLQNEGLLRDVDPETLVRQRIEAMQSQQELLYSFEKLNENLRALLGLDATSHPIWTDCQIEGWEPPTDLQVEVQSALANRSDLQAIQLISGQSNDQLLEAMRGSVRSVSPFAGLVLERRIFGGFFKDHSAEMGKLRNQLAILHAAQTDLAKSTVAENYYLIHRNYQLIQLNQERLVSLRKSESRLEAKRQVGAIKVEEVLSVKAEILKARSAIIHSAVELQMAWIKMKAAQGLLGIASPSTEEVAAQPELLQRTITNDAGLATAAEPDFPTSLRSQQATGNSANLSETEPESTATHVAAVRQRRLRLETLPLR